MNNRKTTRGRKRLVQVIEKVEAVPCPIYGHPPNSVLNPGYNVSTHYYDENRNIVPYTINKVTKRKVIIHKIK